MMFAITRLLAALTLSAALAGSGGTNRIFTIAEANTFRKPEARLVPDITVRGLVISESSGTTFIISDATGNMYLSTDGKPTPRSGEIIEALIRPRTKKEQYKAVHIRNWRSVGSAAVPPPEPVTSREINDERYTFRRITLTGEIEDAAVDELDPSYGQLLVKSGDDTALVSILNNTLSGPVDDLIGAHVRVTGIVMRSQGGHRLITGHCLAVEKDGLAILSHPTVDPFDVDSFPDGTALDPREVVTMGRRRIDGTVEAVWNGGRSLILSRKALRPMRVNLIEPTALAVGDTATAVGIPTTDRFTVRLNRGRIRRTGAGTPYTVPESDPPDADYRNFGRLVRLTGISRGQPAANESGRLELDCGERIISVDATGASDPAALDAIAAGSRIVVTGVCVFDADDWRPNAQFPRIGGYTIVVRDAKDVTVLSAPPWWTSGRLLTLILVLAAALVAILVWNRILQHLVERRGRQLFREQIARTASELKTEERTRLAVELHDAMSQNISSATLQINAAERLADTDRAKERHHLQIAAKTLHSCREELRNCIWDLRNQSIDEPDLNKAITRMLHVLVDEVCVSVRFNVPRNRLSDNTVHAILKTIRELVVNAVRHGKAASVQIAGALDGGRIRFSVTDDGTGFDPDNCPGIADGHFGLQGIRERVRQLQGTLEIKSAPNAGTRVVITLNAPVPKTEDKDTP